MKAEKFLHSKEKHQLPLFGTETDDFIMYSDTVYFQLVFLIYADHTQQIHERANNFFTIFLPSNALKRDPVRL